MRYMKRYVLNTHCTCVHIQNGCKKIMFSSSTGNYYRDQMPTYLKKRQNNTLNKKCVSCYQSLMGCRICERTNKAVEATRLSQKNIIPHIRDFSLYPLQQIQSSKCIRVRVRVRESEKVAYFEPTPTNCRRRPSFEKE